MPNDDLIRDGLKSNFLLLDESTGEVTSSWLWDTTINDYSLSNFIKSSVVDDKVYCEINPSISDYNIPIPLMFIDMSSNAEWTWENFINVEQTPFGSEFSAGVFRYYDQKNTNSEILKGSCRVKIQGTSTKSNAIKNLTFSLRSETGEVSMFVPKSTWLPEEAYTLKADIVDSSHSLNAAMGKFINDELANSEDNNRWFPLDDNALAKFKSTKYYQNSEVKPTMKVAVEGFPFFLIVRFYSPETTEVIVKSLGIYQFILGRDSVHNLGMRILDSVQSNNDFITPDVFPYYKESVIFNELNMQSYWIEATKTYNVSKEVNFSDDNFNIGTCTGLTALCWQPTEGVIN